MSLRFFQKELLPEMDAHNLDAYSGAWAIPWVEVTESEYAVTVLAGNVARVSIEQVGRLDDIDLSDALSTWIYVVPAK
jgi:hypothetical protein